MNLGRKLSEGVGAWLQFEWHCDRSGIFSERYLTLPIGYLLGAEFGTRVHAEVPHPVLAGAQQGPGRRASVDFAVLDPHPRWKVAVESKWVGRTPPTLDSILWDVVRLELIAHHSGADCFLLLGGRKKGLTSLFETLAFRDPRPNGRDRPLLRIDSNSVQRLRLDSASPRRQKLLKKAFKSHQSVDVPCGLRITRSNPFPEPCKNTQYQVYCWKVASAEKRPTFKPRDHKHYSSE